MTALLTLVPTGLVIGLLAFGEYGTRRAPDPNPAAMMLVAAVAILFGPVATLLLGFFGWLVLIAVIVGVLIIAAMLREPPQRARVI